jgi:hypothetical protein
MDEDKSVKKSAAHMATERVAIAFVCAWIIQVLALITVAKLRPVWLPAPTYLIVLGAALAVCLLPAIGPFIVKQWAVGILFLLLGVVAWYVSVYFSGVAAVMALGGVGGTV